MNAVSDRRVEPATYGDRPLVAPSRGRVIGVMEEYVDDLVTI